MNPIIMQMKIDYQNAKESKRELDIKISRLIMELQTYANPYFTSADDIKAEEIEQLGDELLSAVNNLKDLERKLKNLEKDLN